MPRLIGRWSGGGPGPPRARRVLSPARQRGLVEKELDRLDRPELAAAIDGLPEHFLTARPAPAVAAHLILAAEPLAPGQVRTRVLGPDATGVWEVLVVARDRPGLLATVAAVLALRGASVLSADAATREDGVALDAFEVAAEGVDRAGVEADLTAALARESLEDFLRERGAGVAEGAAPAQVTFDNARSSQFTVLEVRTPDRPGLLYQIARGLYDLGLDVHAAEIETHPAGVVDTFRVREVDGAKLDDARAGAVARALERRLAG